MTRTNGKNCNFFHFRTERIEEGKKVERRFLTINDIEEEYGISTYIIYNLLDNNTYRPKKIKDLKIFRERVPVYKVELQETPSLMVSNIIS